MGLFDDMKDLADKHADKVEGALDKVADVVDDRTGGKYSEHIQTGVDKAKELVGDDEGDTATDTEPPSGPTS